MRARNAVMLMAVTMAGCDGTYAGFLNAVPMEEGLFDSIPCYQRFDFLGDGELWMLRSYDDPEAALPGTLDEMFDTIAARARRQQTVLAYLINVDVMGHRYPIDHSINALVE